jgi:hypothetical protein
MRLDPPQSPASPLLWYAVLGAPAAWVGQFAISYWLTEAKCSVAGERWGISVAIGAGLVAIGLFRATGNDDIEGPPPGGRSRFFAAVGLAVTPIFLAIIVLNGVGAVVQSCTQS